ncbi:hypothetical protein A2962_03280 [Candidatus Woesebacteria bacterium RIFCSPLOWO2_01_FULL_39_61]|uniref:Uncharacterized protein n=1 Tax=Candidatus Woesebacteria bacterium RIFCSPHIGHO2_02_FULL_39_13 TaxID=1802505 RepID=A0A1F7Z2H1_9BACT|nr:MAG: hypothetical protein A2692_04365 [Candidatus Woesebacteria bacterium RIFCSPHIGHO2_01_FULL_39_95]OGM33846.1 MAG: hypothetical protein A3D01_02650 [Candidatus Woesebacteria bacterium RIFCSPHIGHO2_02_FULL_39_13]OGM39007.1 MAG: hypothetical protein A3E13_04920 [Candidatus Woesebacteria bacterium RIFCSPHIGHO2_12_FULL_40_20]OGM67512.1 MAG: hypothetical protein A2962_03280 [Candidatus Woesebacteria bacterium RIFCSPLOWO2_01_FULL_39_61]OGM72843.1 MAG: hypothetical protein A3H19_05785 [Candidatus
MIFSRNILGKMIEMGVSSEEREKEFERFIVAQYLRYTSVDEVFRKNNYDLPISYPGVHRLLDRWGIIKAAGPNSKLSEAICFLTCLSDRKIPLERLYKNMPPSFKTSMATMHRIMHNVKKGVVRRAGTALIVTPHDSPDSFLVGNDISTPRIEFGKPYGSVSVPMTFSKRREPVKESILRILQQEVFTENVLSGRTPFEVIPQNPEPFMYLDIADVRVGVYNIRLPKELSDTQAFSSYKLENFRYINFSEVQDNPEQNYRSGITEMATGYNNYLQKDAHGFSSKPVFEISLLNQQLALLPLYSQ